MGMGAGGDVGILGNLAEEKVPDAPSHEISQVSVPVKAVKNLQRFLVDHAS